MAEAGIAAYGAAIGVGLFLAVLAFSLRQRRPHGSEMETYFEEEPIPEPVKEEPKTEEK